MSTAPPISQTYTTTSPYEHHIGYSRAVRRGPFIFVSGTTSISPVPRASLVASASPPPCTVLHPSDPYLQTTLSLTRALEAVSALGGNRESVVRVRMYVRQTGAEVVEMVARGMREVMGGGVSGGEQRQVGVVEGAGWTATMVLGIEFVEKEVEVEVEVDAVVL